MKVHKNIQQNFIHLSLDLAMSTNKSLSQWFEEELESQKDDAEANAYEAMLILTSQVWNRMKQLGLKQTDIADKLNVNKSWISRFFSSPPNMSLQKLFEMGQTVGLELEIRYRPSKVFTKTTTVDINEYNVVSLPLASLNKVQADETPDNYNSPINTERPKDTVGRLAA